MEGSAEEELERRSKFLSSLIQKKKAIEQEDQHDYLNVRVRASDMPLALQNRAFRCARDHLDSMPSKLDSKRLALALKKEFDSSYGPAWHCIVGTSFGSYVTHSIGGFLYFSIDKLFLPECAGLTPEGVIRAVKTLSENHHGLESIRIHGIYNIKKDHLDTIRSYFQMKLPQQEHRRQQPFLFHHRNSPEFRNEESSPMINIDVDICPKCNNVSMVYDCPRETCKKKSCKACNLCIPRCEECGGCIIESEELEATACGDNLCSNCWLQLPKCNFCNQPYCKLHINHQHRQSSSTGFVCDACHVKFVAMLDACYC
ncbi:hypothetical protein SO802_012813 [Lithocarpus litseifolius]|uniref:Dynein light chain n=1 Tax=Lithocarpus litseifolius TaxID=425828 RepID=A0AAW2D607_9ROSI